MELTYIILLILLIIYIPVYFYVRTSQKMKDRGIVVYGPFIMIKTKRGIHLLDGLARHKRFWRVFGTISRIMAIFLMILVTSMMVLNLILLPRMAEMPRMGVEYVLAIPGLNPVIPLVYGIIGLVIAVAIHELAHGIQTRANDMKVESVGILYAVVPAGAFVEPNEEQIKKTDRRARSSMYAAGIAVNFSLALVLFLVMSFGLMGGLSSPYGDKAAVVNVSSGSPADYSKIGYSSVILEINDPVTGDLIASSYDELMGPDVEFFLDNKYSVIYGTKDGPYVKEMYLGVFIDGLVKDGPAYTAGVEKNSFLVSIDGHPVHSLHEFKRIMTEEVAPGQTVEVVYAHFENGVLQADVPVDVQLGDNGGAAFLGVNYSFAGFTFTTPDHVLDLAKNPFHNSESITDAARDAIAYIGTPFRGYSPLPAEVTWWYESGAIPDDVFWAITQTIFWIFWLNLVLAIFNALPAIPFDGGYLFMDGVGHIVDKTHKNSTPERREKIVNITTNVASYAMLFILLLVIVAIVL